VLGTSQVLLLLSFLVVTN